MQPKIELLSPELVGQVLDEAFQLLRTVGVKVHSAAARRLLAEGGALVQEDTEIVLIPESLVRQALETVPGPFELFDRDGENPLHFGDDAVHFDPGSCGVHMLEAQNLVHRPSYTDDLIQIVKLVEMLPQYDAQSTAVVCNEVPKQIGDLYRLYLVLLFSKKPIITGAFSKQTAHFMFDMLALFRGGREGLKQKPLAVFDVCPSPPMIWSDFAAQNLIDLARAGVPAEIVSMPLAGAAAPVTLIGAVVQHTVETLSGITLHQLAQAGAPVIWGGAPAIFDMRYGTTPMGAIETAMIDVATAQIGKSLGIPTHTYLGASDAKLVDAQAGFESGMSALIGALAGINMISGAGMLDFLACQSLEKLVIDAEIIGMIKRLLKGIEVHTDTLATALFENNRFHFKGDFLRQRITRQLFPVEQVLPSDVIDRSSLRLWEEAGKPDAFQRAGARVRDLLANYRRPPIDEACQEALVAMVRELAKEAGLDSLPKLPGVVE
ncbi:MAG: Trimethylamine:corrinoid methyltransferase [Anaerolineae bacterium]|nr:MAG: Trimethylamine:corrinoid methyltransferase [Anaerolineae bacterium]